jgi:hypothetical protein
MSDYDSTQDTNNHINTVRVFMAAAIYNLEQRRMAHDASKLTYPEKEMYDQFTPKLKELVYGSDEYRASLAAMGPALEHHYQVNSHHPEHFADGVNGMSLFDLLEMVCDWKAAAQRHTDGSLGDSFKINQARFEIPESLMNILRNTVEEMKW